MTTVLGFTHVVEELSFSMFPSILRFDFDLFLGSFFTFWGPHGLFLGWGRVRQLIWALGSTHVVGQISFLTFDFDLIFGSFYTFLGPNRLFLGWGRVRQLF